MEEKWIEVKVMNCKDVKVFNFFQKPPLYAVVSIVGKLKHTPTNENEQRTATDSEGDANNPEWNHQMRFHLPDDYCNDDLFLNFDVRCEGVFGVGDRSVGDVGVPLKDLIEDSPSGIVRFVSYEVRTSDGKPNGVLNFSFKANINETAPTTNQIIHGYPILVHAAAVEAEAEENWKVEYPSLEDSDTPSYLMPSYQLHQPYYHPPPNHHLQLPPSPPPPPPPLPYPPHHPPWAGAMYPPPPPPPPPHGFPGGWF